MRGVAPDVEFDRALATIGLLRHVTDAVPVDAVCVYSNQTKQSYGIRALTDRIGYYEHWYDEKPQKTIHDEKDANAAYVIPNSLIKMTKDYITRAFWKNIDHLISSERIRIDDGCWCDRGNMDTQLRTFPKAILNTIAGLRLSKYANLWDSKNAIESLHSVCVPDTFEEPKYMLRDNAPSQDVFKMEHKRNISTLSAVLRNYCWNATNRQSIPNQAEKNLLLDLIESFTILFGCSGSNARGGYFNNYLRKQLYEFARKTDKLDRNKSLRFLTFEAKAFDVRIGNGGFDLSTTNKYIEDIRHMSAEAAICLRTLARYNPDENRDPETGTFVPNPTELARLKPQPLNEVAIYLRTERALALVKSRHIDDALEDKRGGYELAEPCCCEPVGDC